MTPNGATFLFLSFLKMFVLQCLWCAHGCKSMCILGLMGHRTNGRYIPWVFGRLWNQLHALAADSLATGHVRVS